MQNSSTSNIDLTGRICYIYRMRLNKPQVEHLAFILARRLIKENNILVESKEKLIEDFQTIISHELEMEDQLDDRVKEILKEKLPEIRNSNIDYYEMFTMVKKKLAEQENIIL